MPVSETALRIFDKLKGEVIAKLLKLKIRIFLDISFQLKMCAFSSKMTIFSIKNADFSIENAPFTIKNVNILQF